MAAHILLVESDALLAQTYRRAFEERGYTVATAPDAQTAVQLADEQTPGAVVLELELPAHNGIEFLYEFRSYSEWLKVPVLVHSFVPPSAFEQTSLLGKELGIVTYLYKPTTSLAKLVRSTGMLLGIRV